ncbi:hypothetical protein O181_096658 [Austropuccinia psidii MF-1]|uniref:Uncharacterized protein n=1 Tax=Austropuccinia psidii MF-1 TaxID=1389203 RepID=A0A9Q3J5Z4_9BASI|nr:hypothetical protein [Austropuccinia psidii MF-1]
MIQTLEDMVRGNCAYGVETQDCDVFTHDEYTLLPALELPYKAFNHGSTNCTPAILEKGWNPRLPQDSLRKNSAEISPTAASFKVILENSRSHEVRFMADHFSYGKIKWNKSLLTKNFKVVDLVLVSATKSNNITECKKLKDSFSGTFIIEALHGEKTV